MGNSRLPSDMNSGKAIQDHTEEELLAMVKELRLVKLVSAGCVVTRGIVVGYSGPNHGGKDEHHIAVLYGTGGRREYHGATLVFPDDQEDVLDNENNTLMLDLNKAVDHLRYAKLNSQRTGDADGSRLLTLAESSITQAKHLIDMAMKNRKREY